MGHIVSIHSYRGGTGKSNITANLAYQAVAQGKRVAVLDTDLQSPGVHVVYQMDKGRIAHTLSDFLFGRCELEESAYDLTDSLGLQESGGALYLLPSSMNVESIMRILSEGYDVGKLNNHFGSLMDSLNLDLLFLDTHPGLNRETMLTTSISDTLIILIRPDNQDFHGTAVLVEVAGRLGVPQVYMVANKVVSSLDKTEVRRKIHEAFGYEVLGVLPLSEDLASLGSRGLFTVLQPSHTFSMELIKVANRVLADFEKEPE
jgi:MinD-like ATPase involved in chromosome partitioning or flagellar assembly